MVGGCFSWWEFFWEVVRFDLDIRKLVDGLGGVKELRVDECVCVCCVYIYMYVGIDIKDGECLLCV